MSSAHGTGMGRLNHWEGKGSDWGGGGAGKPLLPLSMVLISPNSEPH